MSEPKELPPTESFQESSVGSLPPKPKKGRKKRKKKTKHRDPSIWSHQMSPQKIYYEPLETRVERVTKE